MDVAKAIQAEPGPGPVVAGVKLRLALREAKVSAGYDDNLDNSWWKLVEQAIVALGLSRTNREAMDGGVKTSATAAEEKTSGRLADVVRKAADAAFRAAVEDWLASWRAECAADPSRPAPPDLALALNPHWWSEASAGTCEATPLPAEVDPIYRFGFPDVRALTREGITAADFRDMLMTRRASAFREAARPIFEAISTGETQLLGEWDSALGSGAPEILPYAGLKSRRWRLLPNSSIEFDHPKDHLFSEVVLSTVTSPQVVRPTADHAGRGSQAVKQKPDLRAAKAILSGIKVDRAQRGIAPPTEAEAKGMLSTLTPPPSRQQIRGLLKQLWPKRKRGRRERPRLPA